MPAHFCHLIFQLEVVWYQHNHRVVRQQMTIQIWRCPHLRTDIIDVLNWAGGTFSNHMGTGLFRRAPRNLGAQKRVFPEKRTDREIGNLLMLDLAPQNQEPNGGLWILVGVIYPPVPTWSAGPVLHSQQLVENYLKWTQTSAATILGTYTNVSYVMEFLTWCFLKSARFLLKNQL